MRVESKIHHAGKWGLVDIEHTLEVGVKALVYSSVLCYNPQQSEVRQTHHGSQPEFPQVAVFARRKGHKYPTDMETYLKSPICPSNTFSGPLFWGVEISEIDPNFLFAEAGKTIAHRLGWKQEFRVIPRLATCWRVNSWKWNYWMNWFRLPSKTSWLRTYAEEINRGLISIKLIVCYRFETSKSAVSVWLFNIIWLSPRFMAETKFLVIINFTATKQVLY